MLHIVYQAKQAENRLVPSPVRQNVASQEHMSRMTFVNISAMRVSDASISVSQFRYDIDTILTKYRDIDIDI